MGFKKGKNTQKWSKPNQERHEKLLSNKLFKKSRWTKWGNEEETP